MVVPWCIRTTPAPRSMTPNAADAAETASRAPSLTIVATSSGLTAAARKNYRRYSLGMKQRLGIAAALLRPRELLILDEPTNGLDPQGTREVRTLVAYEGH